MSGTHDLKFWTVVLSCMESSIYLSLGGIHCITICSRDAFGRKYFAVGGVIGFFKTGSNKSLLAGGGSALVLYYVYLTLPRNPFLASAIGLGKLVHLLTLGLLMISQHQHLHDKDLCHLLVSCNPWCPSAVVLTLATILGVYLLLY
jgi:hypothetical protein